ncbi:conserved hypothetical protein [Theileria equi strain WA]|uniref:Uncharacterized protein n=1 Tax=Theileria equi strain WA TaxID=1537102 RepID=L1LCS8_THEEQ|nr:conserved hypothetical protein [Theileria equi strain WA]EKX73146.1 conserved hypothetical protein [Theileria equi strain WA]|eukprot:XP_004832598.1 conserved hypothetical protein [Theileria equi strain WA]
MESNDPSQLLSGVPPCNVDKLEIINIKKFLLSRSKEIDDMFNLLKRDKKQDRAFQRLPFVMRRRAMSHNPFRIPKSIRMHVVREMAKNMPKAAKRLRKDKQGKLNRLEEYQQRCAKNKWLETHIYHAKRFKMTNIWGYRLALTSTQKSKRRFMRFTKRRCVIHDRSYTKIIAITGQVDSMKETFKHVFLDSEMIFIDSYLSGMVRGGCSFAYSTDKSNPKLISPVNYIWKPSDGGNRTIWFFVHPTACDQLFDILSSFTNLSTKMIDEIVIFELHGPLSSLFLKSVLKINSNISKGNSLWKSLNPENIKLPPSFILPLLIKVPEVYGSFRPGFKIDTMKKNPFMDEDINIPNLDEERGKLFDYKSDNKVETKSRFNVPRLRRKNYPKLVEKILKFSNIQYPKSGNETHFEDENMDIDGGLEDKEQVIPVWVISRSSPLIGFDLLIPANSFSSRIWTLLNRYGALGLGLEDREMIMNEFDQPTFPQDYPETDAGWLHYSNLKNDEITKYLVRPAAKRPNYSLIGIDDPFTFPVNDHKFLNLKISPDLIPKSNLGSFDGFILKSRHILLGCITSGLYHCQENQDFVVIRPTTVSTHPYSRYIIRLVNSIQSRMYDAGPINDIVDYIPSRYYVSAKVSPLSKGSVEFLDRIYAMDPNDFKLFSKQLLRDLCSRNNINFSSHCPKLTEPRHDEYQISKLKVSLYGDLKNCKLDEDIAVKFLNDLNNKGLKNTRECIGFVTSKCMYTFIYPG